MWQCWFLVSPRVELVTDEYLCHMHAEEIIFRGLQACLRVPQDSFKQGQSFTKMIKNILFITFFQCYYSSMYMGIQVCLFDVDLFSYSSTFSRIYFKFCICCKTYIISNIKVRVVIRNEGYEIKKT